MRSARRLVADSWILRLSESADRWLCWGERWPLLVPVCLGIGVCLYHAIRFEPTLAAVSIAATAVLAICGLGWIAAGHVMWPLLASCAALGVLAAKLEVDRSGGAMLVDPAGPIELVGTVVAIDADEDRTRIRLTEVAIDGKDRTIRLRLHESDPYSPIIGDKVVARAIVFPPPGPVLPGAYDFRRYSFFSGLDGTGVALDPIVRMAGGEGEGSLTQLAAAWRLGVADRILAVIAPPASSIAIALLTGDRSRMPVEIYDRLRDAGLAHLLAISGLHVGLVAGFFFAMTRFGVALWPYVAERWDTKKVAAIAGIAAAFIYTVMVGGTVPTQRAFIMTALALTAILLDRSPLSMRLVAVAAALVMVIAPSGVVEPSFQMSFAAVIALIATYEALTRDGVRRLSIEGSGTAHRIAQYTGGVFLTSIIAGLATAPFAMFHFQHLATYGLVSNLIAVPLTAFWIMPLGIVALSAMPLGLEWLPLVLMGFGIDLLLEIAGHAARWPYAAITVAKPSVAAMSLLTAAGLWLALFRGPGRLLGLAPLTLGVIMIGTAAPTIAFVDARDGTIGIVSDGTGSNRRTLWLSDRRLSTYGRDHWQRAGLATDTRLMPFEGRQTARADATARSDDETTDTIRCDGEGCIVRPAVGRFDFERLAIAIPRTRRALNEDCGIADLIITSMTVDPIPPPCQSIPVIDRSFVESVGSVAITNEGRSAKVKTVKGYIGRRPWSEWYFDDAAD